MSAVGTITALATRVVGTTVHTVRHPVQSVSHATDVARGAAGLARGAAGAVIGRRHEDTPAPSTPPPEAAAAAAAAAGIAPTPPPDPVTTEPSAASRQAAHGGRGGGRGDDPMDEVGEDEDFETPVGTTGAGPGYNPDTGEADLQQPDTAPLMDPSLTKAVKSESETLRKASDPDKG